VAGSEIVLCRLDMLVPLDPKRDLRLSGQVIYTGNSSMEVAVKMEHIGMDELEETVLLGAFLPHKVKVQLLIA
jgi:acyl-coenzyme A thioesterase 9